MKQLVQFHITQQNVRLLKMRQILKKFHLITEISVIVPPTSPTELQRLQRVVHSISLPQSILQPADFAQIKPFLAQNWFSACGENFQILPSGKAILKLNGSEKEFTEFQSHGGFVYFDLQKEKRQINKIQVYSFHDFQHFVTKNFLQIKMNQKGDFCDEPGFSLHKKDLSQKNLQFLQKMKKSVQKENLKLQFLASQNFETNFLLQKEEEKEAFTPQLNEQFDGFCDQTTILEWKGVCNGTQLQEIFNTGSGEVFFVKIKMGDVLGYGGGGKSEAVIIVGKDIWVEVV